MKERGLVLLGLVGSCLCAQGRTWTSLDGKTAEAEFQALEGATLLLVREAKTIRMPLDAFCEADQAFVRERMQELEAEHERLAQEQRERFRNLLGVRNHVPVTERRWADWQDYYTESLCGRKMIDFFKNERSIVDVPEKGVFVSPEEAVRPPGYAPTMDTYCPEDYDGNEKLGVYIHISAGDRAAGSKSGYQEMMRKHRLVYASPHGAGNKESDMRRCALALDVLAQLRREFVIDENRIYIGGTSGGGAESTFATFLYPQDFRAAFNSVRSFYVTSSTCLPFADEGDIREASKNKQPFAFISGPGDFNYKYMPKTEQNFLDHGFVARFFDVPGMKHQMASPETFDEVIRWVEANNPGK
jgi:predicted esterase